MLSPWLSLSIAFLTCIASITFIHLGERLAINEQQTPQPLPMPITKTPWPLPVLIAIALSALLAFFFGPAEDRTALCVAAAGLGALAWVDYCTHFVHEDVILAVTIAIGICVLLSGTATSALLGAVALTGGFLTLYAISACVIERTEDGTGESHSQNGARKKKWRMRFREAIWPGDLLIAFPVGLALGPLGLPWLLISLSIAVLIGLIWGWHYRPKPMPMGPTFALMILVGAIGAPFASPLLRQFFF